MSYSLIISSVSPANGFDSRGIHVFDFNIVLVCTAAHIGSIVHVTAIDGSGAGNFASCFVGVLSDKLVFKDAEFPLYFIITENGFVRMVPAPDKNFFFSVIFVNVDVILAHDIVLTITPLLRIFAILLESLVIFDVIDIIVFGPAIVLDTELHPPPMGAQLSCNACIFSVLFGLNKNRFLSGLSNTQPVGGCCKGEACHKLFHGFLVF